MLAYEVAEVLLEEGFHCSICALVRQLTLGCVGCQHESASNTLDD